MPVSISQNEMGVKKTLFSSGKGIFGRLEIGNDAHTQSLTFQAEYYSVRGKKSLLDLDYNEIVFSYFV